MEEKTINELFFQLKSKLDLVMKRLNEIEHRLGNLEQKIGGSTTILPAVREPIITTSHSYLKKVIKSALSRYQGK